MTNRTILIRELLATLVMTVIMCLISPISVRLSFTEVPMSFGSLAVCAAGAVLGPNFGLLSVVIYLVLGALGLPVFAGGASGAGVFTGPTGGYLLGYLACVFVVGLIIDRDRFRLHMYPVSMIAGMLLCHVFGLIGLALFQKGLTLAMALRLGFVPFVLFDLIKIGIATIVSYPVGTRLKSFLRS